MTFLLGTFVLNAQRYNKPKPKNSYAQGAIFVHWGYNRNFYSKSDINFAGAGYNFTLHGCQAEDRPEKFSFDTYIKNLTVPQFNFRIGYVYKHHWAISLGYDHMKYVLKDNLPYTLSGQIDSGLDEVTNWSGSYVYEPVTTQEETFHYENTNGLNYIHAQVTRIDQWIREKKSGWFGFSSLLGFGAGTILSISDFTFAGQKSMQTTSMSGFGASGHVDLRFEFFKHFYIQADYKIGYINMPNIKTSLSTVDSASQSFYFFQNNLLIGGKFRLF